MGEHVGVMESFSYDGGYMPVYHLSNSDTKKCDLLYANYLNFEF